MVAYMGYYSMDPTWILILVGVVITMLASAKVNGTFRKYSAVASKSGMTGEETARRILSMAGLSQVRIEPITGNLTDHYDPKNQVLRLSEPVYGKSSVAAVSVAAHECGHAIQHANGYVPLRIRTAVVPVVNFGSVMSWPVILLGVVFGGLGSPLVTIGILLFSICVAFQLLTLPVELNASHRAENILREDGVLQEEELKLTKKVLGAAALTYVAAAASSILQLLRLLMIFGGGRRRD